MNRLSLTIIVSTAITSCLHGAAAAPSIGNAYFVSTPTRTLESLLEVTGVNHDRTPEGIRKATQKPQPEGWFCPRSNSWDWY